MAWLSNVLVYTGGYLFLVFIAVCLATGLYYLAEIVEEYEVEFSWAIKIGVGMNGALVIAYRSCASSSRAARRARTGPCSSDSRSWSLPPRVPRFRRHAHPEPLHVDRP